MRTKLLLCAAVLAVSALTSMAQVYSLNIVGYYQVTCNPGFTAVANQLDATPDNTVLSVVTGLPDNGSLSFWDGSAFAENIYYGGGLWDDPSVLYSPGKGAFVKNPTGSPITLTFVGQVPTGVRTENLAPGFSFVGHQIPQAGNLQVDMNLQPNDNDSVSFWDGSAFAEDIYYGGGLWDADPNVTVGQAFFYKNGTGSTLVWSRTFNP